MKNQELLKINVEEFQIEETQATELTIGLIPSIQERELLISEFEDVSKLEINEENLNTFKELRLKFVKNRTQGISKWHKVSKDYFLKGGQFVDAIKRKEIAVNEKYEELLMRSEKHFENLEKERKMKVQSERESILRGFEVEIIPSNLCEMTDDVWNSYLLGTKSSYEAKKEAEAKAEAERIENERKAKLYSERKELLIPFWNVLKEDHKSVDFGELTQEQFDILISEAESDFLEYQKKQEEIKLENERLKKEAEEKAKKEEAERKAREEAERKERERHEAELKAEREKAEKIQAELKAKEEAERKAREEAEKLKELELKKGDSEKVNDLINDLELLKTKYSFSSKENKRKYNDVSLLIDKVINHIKQ